MENSTMPIQTVFDGLGNADIAGFEVTVYVPSTVNMPHLQGGFSVVSTIDSAGLAVIRAGLINDLTRAFTKDLGGATLTEAQGFYRDSRGQIVPEHITKVSVFVDAATKEIDKRPAEQYFREITRQIAYIFRQESVTLTYTPIFVQFVK